MNSLIVIGIGNILFQDEGVGIYASAYLERNYTFVPEIEIIDGGTLGFKLMTYYQSHEKVIIVDTVSISDTAGSVYNLPSEELMGLGTYRQTAHEVEVVEMLEICSMLEKIAQVNIIGIIPEDIQTVNIGLSHTMKNNFQNLIRVLIEEIERFGVTVVRKNEEFTLDAILHEYNSPSASRQS